MSDAAPVDRKSAIAMTPRMLLSASTQQASGVLYSASHLIAHLAGLGPCRMTCEAWLRMAAGISQAELAERMGVDRAYVSGLELGQRNPTVVTLWHIGKALGVKLRAFFDERAPRGSAKVECRSFLG